jgi:hypothetical protein
MTRSRRARIEPLEERQLLSIDLVSIAPVSSTGNFASEEASVNFDGRYVAFASDATNLVASDTNAKRDIFIIDRTVGTTVLASTDAAGNQANGVCDWPYLNADGRYVAFQSGATNLVTGDTNAVTDVFRRDLLDGATIRISTDNAGAEGDAACAVGGISSDGRYVVFETAGKLAGGSVQGISQVVVKDVLTGTTTLASADAAGSPANNYSVGASISGDGRYVGFISNATNLVSDDATGYDLFVKDLSTGAVVRVATDVPAFGDTRSEYATSLSEDGRYIAFRNRPADAGTSWTEVFVADLIGRATRKVSVGLEGVTSNGGSDSARISSDGRYVAFHSLASNLVIDDTNGCADIFVKDQATGVTTRISQDANGQQGNAASLTPRISGDGRIVAFQSVATNLAVRDYNSSADVFISERTTAALSLQSARLGATPCGGNGHSMEATLSGDGRYVAFTTWSTDLGRYDGNGAAGDIYLRDVVTGTTARVDPGFQFMGGLAQPSLSGDGRHVAYASSPTNFDGFAVVQDLSTGASTSVSGPPRRYLFESGPLMTLRNAAPSLSNDGRYVAFAATYSYRSSSTDAYIQDLSTGTQTVLTSGTPGVEPQISGDGRYVVYANGYVYVYDRLNATSTVASTDTTGTQAIGADPAINTDGRYVAFSSTAENLVADDTNETSDIFVKDLISGVTVRVSTNGAGEQANGPSLSPRISGDGRYLVFQSEADNLVPDDTNGRKDVFVKDLVTGSIARVNLADDGQQANQDCGAAAISSDGRFIAFQTAATNLHPADTSNTLDVYRVWNPLVSPELTLYGTSVAENQPAGTVFGVLATGAASAGPFTYTLVAGEGDVDNSAFAIEGNTLKTTGPFDFETLATYTIRVRSTDGTGVSCEHSFSITVDDLQSIASPAVYDSETSFFSLRGANSGESTDTSFGYGEPGADWIPLVGDWNGDQASGVGFYDPEGSCFYLTDSHEGGYSQYAFGYGEPGAGWIPLVGDWNGDGRSGVGLYNPHSSTFYLTDSLVDGFAQYTFGYGEPGAGWAPLVGDWDGNGRSGVALYDPHNFAFYLTDSLQTGIADHYYRDANAKAGWQPLVGDWDGDGSDGLGLYASESSVFHLVNVTATGYVPYTLGYGQPGAGWQPLVGDWDGNGACGVGLYDPSTSTFYLKDRLTSGFADYTYVFGTSGAAQVLIGRWTTAEAEVAAQAVDQLDLAGLAEEELGALAVIPTTP